ncbi:MAG: nickel-responsive transcriptional regulator NikR [Pseudolabrys sp.]
MQRITITIDDDLLDVVDTLKQQRGYDSRSEAFRDIVRDVANRQRAEESGALCIAVLSYVFDYETRDLAQRLTRIQHEHHDMFAANMRVPLDHASCLELSALRGRSRAVRELSDRITTQRGVRHASLHVVPVTVSSKSHRHGEGGVPHEHIQA